MNTCDRCGSAVRPTASFCPNCGAPLGNVNVSGGTDLPAEEAPDTRRSQPRRDPDSDMAATAVSGLGGLPGEAPQNQPSMWDASTPPERPAGTGGSPFDLPPSGAPFGTPAGAGSGRPEIYSTPTGAGAGMSAVRRRLPLIIGCCAGLLLLGCILILAFGSAIMNSTGSF